MSFISRHIGPTKYEQQAMLLEMGFNNLDDFINNVIPKNLFSNTSTIGKLPLSEFQALQKLSKIAAKNKIYKNYIGMGYSETITPAVIKRNVFENPGWYTAYTPYQAEISQGRLEALLNYQQMIMDLTGFDLSNASLLDEATAAAEAMLMASRINNPTNNKRYFVDSMALPQSIAVLKTRAKYAEIDIIVGNINDLQSNVDSYFGAFIQNPNVVGEIRDYTNLIKNAKVLNSKLVVTMACDLLSLVIFKSAAVQGADIAIGSSQRFGVPMGFGGPAAGYIATHSQYKRMLSGRIIGVSVDSHGKKALRMSLQTREQHIRREKATSNICTAQVLLANMAGFYAVYHGKDGLKAIANKIHALAVTLMENLLLHKFNVINTSYLFDTVNVECKDVDRVYNKLLGLGYLVGRYQDRLIISFGEMTEIEDVSNILGAFLDTDISIDDIQIINSNDLSLKYQELYRTDNILSHEVFNQYHSETKMMRYLKYLENKDISLVHSMIPLGSCTMKLNAASELEPVSWANIANIHPFAPENSIDGYKEIIQELTEQLKSITGFADISMQPNSGAQGEYAGLLAIRRYQESIGEGYRNICLIPSSAHGTNPASAQMMGMEIVVIKCDEKGNIDIDDLKEKALYYKKDLACLMVTYPSTHGVFEVTIKDICRIIHENGGQVYMDGANLNALVGLVKPAELGADVSHINLHKTFAIPHGGGGPGMGPIGVQEHLIPFLPSHPLFSDFSINSCDSSNSVSAAPFGSSSILVISWMYISMLGDEGLSYSTKVAILNANYIAFKLKEAFPILYTGENTKVAHECIIDLRPLKATTGITEVDIAKRLMDYGFHSPTMSFPVPGTLMIEPTESEAKDELDRFISAMLNIHAEIMDIKNGKFDKLNNPLKNAPHSLADVRQWDKPYSIQIGCFPLEYLENNKIFPSVNRIDDAYGDRNFICNCFDFN